MAPAIANGPIVSWQIIATGIGLKIGSIVSINEASILSTLSNPFDKNIFANPYWNTTNIINHVRFFASNETVESKNANGKQMMY